MSTTIVQYTLWINISNEQIEYKLIWVTTIVQYTLYFNHNYMNN